MCSRMIGWQVLTNGTPSSFFGRPQRIWGSKFCYDLLHSTEIGWRIILINYNYYLFKAHCITNTKCFRCITFCNSQNSLSSFRPLLAARTRGLRGLRWLIQAHQWQTGTWTWVWLQSFGFHIPLHWRTSLALASTFTFPWFLLLLKDRHFLCKPRMQMSD